MSERIHNLADCSEFRQTLLARSPKIVHGTVFLLVSLLVTAVTWAALTEADLVVRAAGRVRPVSTPKKVVNATRGEVISASAGGRVIAVHFKQGDTVRKGDALVTLDTEHLDNEIARRRRTIRAAEDELVQFQRVEKLLADQGKSALAKAEAELKQLQAELRQAKERRDVEIELAEVEVATAEDDLSRTRRLAASRSVSAADLVKAKARASEARERLKRAKLTIDESKAPILSKAHELAGREAALRQEEAALKRVQKQGEVDAARLELSSLELERKQAVLRAPLDGVVTSGEVKPGDVLETGKVVAEIAEQKGFRFEAAITSDQVGHLKIGMPVNIKLDAYDYQKYGVLAGTVEFISPDSGVVEGQRGAFYVVRVRVESETVGRGDLQGQVKLGMTGQAEIVTDQESLLLILVKKVRMTSSLG
jgi:hemolysin D